MRGGGRRGKRTRAESRRAAQATGAGLRREEISSQARLIAAMRALARVTISGGRPRAMTLSGWWTRTSSRQRARTASIGASRGRPRTSQGSSRCPSRWRELDLVEGTGRYGEDPGDGAKEPFLALVVAAVGEGDVEQALEDVLEHRGAVAEHRRDAGGVGVEAGDVLAGEVEDAGGGGLVLAGDLEDPAEGRDLGGADEAVGLGHLGAEADDGDGEGDAALGRAAAIEDGKQALAAGDEGGDRLGDKGPDRHRAEVSRCRRGCRRELARGGNRSLNRSERAARGLCSARIFPAHSLHLAAFAPESASERPSG